MKFILALFTVSVCSFGLIHALPNERHKRAPLIDRCPADIPCETYVQKLKEENPGCIDYVISGDIITIASCGIVHCTGDLKEKTPDLTKPFPGCCPQCE